MLYWCGVRMGALLALTPVDFDFDRHLLTINKSYQRIKGQDIITTPKTRKSSRTIKLPQFLCDEIQDYIGMQYGIKPNDRPFTVTKSYLHHKMDRGAKTAGVKWIRIHDLRHSHVSLLIEMTFSAVAIADCLGHESIEIITSVSDEAKRDGGPAGRLRADVRAAEAGLPDPSEPCSGRSL